MTETIQATIGKLIKKKRLEKNLTLLDVSKIGFGSEHSESHISKIEKGYYKNVSIDTIDKIFIGLGLDLKSILLLIDLDKEIPNDFELGNKTRKPLNETK